MHVCATSIPGMLKVDLDLHCDGRGWFKEGYQRAKLAAQGFPPFQIMQSNVSFNADVGVTRGIHAEPWDKYISLANGRAFAAVVDLRDGPTFGQVETVDLIRATRSTSRGGAATATRRPRPTSSTPISSTPTGPRARSTR